MFCLSSRLLIFDFRGGPTLTSSPCCHRQPDCSMITSWQSLCRQICWPLTMVHTLSHKSWPRPSTRFMSDPNRSHQSADVTYGTYASQTCRGLNGYVIKCGAPAWDPYVLIRVLYSCRSFCLADAASRVTGRWPTCLFTTGLYGKLAGCKWQAFPALFWHTQSSLLYF